MKKICVFTGTRAEYGLLYHTIKAIDKSPSLKLQLVVTGSHLSPKHGMTVDAIRDDGIKINHEIDMLMDSANKSAIAKSMGILMIQLADCFDRLRPDMLLILGDRYEILAAASCAVAMNIPIAHMCGGEAAEGVIDEQIRHSVTKMANLHFATTEIYKNRILKMGEQAFRVFNVGAPVVENIKRRCFLSREQLESELKVTIEKPLLMITYHPVTLMDHNTERQIENLLGALEKFEGTFIFTGANADFAGDIINGKLKKYVSNKENCHFYQNLGNLYLDACKHADVMVGNSSSGIAEAPCFRLPVVNIGDRQRGRLRHPNIIDVGYDIDSIACGIDTALHDTDMRSRINDMEVLYGNGTTSEDIVAVLERTEINEAFLFKSLCFDDIK